VLDTQGGEKKCGGGGGNTWAGPFQNRIKKVFVLDRGRKTKKNPLAKKVKGEGRDHRDRSREKPRGINSFKGREGARFRE